MQPQHGERNSANGMEDTLDFSSGPFPDRGFEGAAEGGKADRVQIALHQASPTATLPGSTEPRRNIGRAQRELSLGHIHPTTAIVPPRSHHAPSISNFTPLTTAAFNASSHDTIAGYFDGTLNQPSFMNTVFDSSTPQLIAPPINSTHLYDDLWSQQSRHLRGLENFQDVSADAGLSPFGISSTDTRNHNALIANEFPWLTQVTHPVYGFPDFQHPPDDRMSDLITASTAIFDHFETVNGFVANGYDDSFQTPNISGGLGTQHHSLFAQETFNTEEVGFDYSSPAANVEINDALLHPLGISPDFPLGAMPVSPILPAANAIFVATSMGNSIRAAAPSVASQQARPRFQCTNCNATFKRASDRNRHNGSIHQAIQGIHLCPITTCPKSQGNGYSRADKLTEHLWKKHGDLGYAKAV